MTDLDSVGLLDTSAVIDIAELEPGVLLPRMVTTAVTLAELAAGPLSTKEPAERARRIARMQWALGSLEALPFDTEAARYYNALCSLVFAIGRHPRRRIADLMIASTAAAHGLPLYTRNPEDFKGLDSLVRIVRV